MTSNHAPHTHEKAAQRYKKHTLCEIPNYSQYGNILDNARDKRGKYVPKERKPNLKKTSLPVRFSVTHITTHNPAQFIFFSNSLNPNVQSREGEFVFVVCRLNQLVDREIAQGTTYTGEATASRLYWTTYGRSSQLWWVFPFRLFETSRYPCRFVLCKAAAGWRVRKP